MIDEYLQGKIAEVNQYLKEYMDLLPDHISTKLKESMTYSLFAGGKRLRPILLMEFGEYFGENTEGLKSLACAVEMIHTYSLIHDDLPAMDDDDYRRGKLTNHKVYGEDMAILAGDALLNYAFEIMLDFSLYLNGNEQVNYIKAAKEIAHAAGPCGMITGQAADIANVHLAGDQETLDFINKHKTGALIKASIIAGPIAQGADQKTIVALTAYSEKIGLAFQIVDDILDVTGEEKKLGKKVHSDEKNDKKTYVDIYGVERSVELVGTLAQEALAHLEESQISSQTIVDLTEFICKRDH